MFSFKTKDPLLNLQPSTIIMLTNNEKKKFIEWTSLKIWGRSIKHQFFYSINNRSPNISRWLNLTLPCTIGLQKKEDNSDFGNIQRF